MSDTDDISKTMIEKIVSGGQTGVDRAALDAAMRWKIPHGGWIPKGRKTEDGGLPNKYQLEEMPTDSYSERTEKNVLDSDGTLIISHGPLTGGSNYTREQALKHNRPNLHIDLNKTNSFKAAQIIYNWIIETDIKTLNVAGPRASEDEYIYRITIQLLTTVFHMELIETSMPDPNKATPFLPQTVDQAVDILIKEMTLYDKTSIARMKEYELAGIYPGLGGFIRTTFGLWSGNEALLQDCRTKLNKDDMPEDEASTVIVKELWKQLRKTHALRIVD
jgi:hypothetical protein